MILSNAWAGGETATMDTALSGIGKGVVNFLVGTANGVANASSPGTGAMSSLGDGPIPSVPYNSEAEASYGIPTTLGLTAGTAVAGGAVGGTASSGPVVPEATTGVAAAGGRRCGQSKRPPATG